MKEIQVMAAILVQDGRLFATQRGYGPDKDGWEFPGGKVEPGEDKRDAIKREMKEELLVDIEPGEALPEVVMDYPAFRIHLHCYLCTLVSGKLTLLEHEAARWLSREELDLVSWLPADREVIELLKKKNWDGRDEEASGQTGS